MIEYEKKLDERNEKSFQKLVEFQGISARRVIGNIIRKLEEYQEAGIKLEIEIIKEYRDDFEIIIMFLQKIQEKIGVPAFWITEQAIEEEKNFRY
ncbi:MAG: hypothetical protein ACOC1K_00750 [Nanoarchaeota archaeon]